MGNILLFSGGRSGNNASMTLVQALIENGHRVVYFDIANDRPYLERQGYEVYSLKPVGLEKRERPKKDPFVFLKFRAMIRQKMQSMDLIYSYGEQWLDVNGIDLVLMDSNSFELAVPFLKKKIPIVNVTCTLSALNRNGGPPVFSRLVPSNDPGVFSGIRYRMAWFRILFPQYIKEGMAAILLRIAFGTRPFESIEMKIKKYGGTLKRTEYGRRLSAPEIIMGPKCIDYPLSREVPGRMYANACVYEGRKDLSFDFACLDQKKPIIYCAVGTCSGNYAHKNNLQLCVVKAMEMLPDYQLLLQGAEEDQLDFGTTMPSNVRIAKILPQLEVLKRAKIFITHGGFASIREGVFYGVPMMVFPGWHDQFGNAAKVVYHGIGLRGNMRNIKPRKLVGMVKEIASSDEIARRIQTMQKEMRKQDELNASIEFIESMLKSK